MKSYRLFLWFNIETEPNLLSFCFRCKNMVRKPLYHSLKEFHDTMIKQQQINFHTMNSRQLCLLHSNQNWMNCRFILFWTKYSAGKIFETLMNIVTSTIHIKAIYIAKPRKKNLSKKDSKKCAVSILNDCRNLKKYAMWAKISFQCCAQDFVTERDI